MKFFPFGSSDDEKQFKVQDRDKIKATNHFDKRSSNYDRKVTWGPLSFFRRKERAAVLELADLNQPNLTLIDIGCGAGFYSLEAKKRGLIVHSADISQKMLKNVEGYVDRVHIFDIESNLIEQKFDRVICAGVLDFVRNPEVAFSNLCRLVSPGGKLVILCPRQGMGGLFYRCEKYLLGMQINLFSSDWLSSQASKHGLKISDISYPLPTNMAIRFE